MGTCYRRVTTLIESNVLPLH